MPPASMSLSAAALWLLPRLVSREVLSPEQSSVLKMAALRGEPQLLAPVEVCVLGAGAWEGTIFPCASGR